MRVYVVILHDALDVDVVDVTVLAVHVLCTVCVAFLLIADDLCWVRHPLRVLHLLLIHKFLIVGWRQHALVEHLRVLQFVLEQHFVDLGRIELRDYNILIILWLSLGNLISGPVGQHF